MEQNIKSDNQEQNLEFNKIQGFDVLEKLPEDSKMKSYNEEYYSSLFTYVFTNGYLVFYESCHLANARNRRLWHI